ncbi:NADH-quinone oxidoreductase subunit NuoG [Crenobacter caeni]|uniref:NADH-quinone oxidoreductase n=1 Tax=Crenobacter caeni TaxID=2705474 RepID=A0A6B2KP30_9NEIS|nr:NADH-quinone oxidoreductase subunit NuoG [Crenobacter caeni]NDV11996.1 NADH-quinone oxidoreductase subunit G [Crenobacter caeni]
MLEIEIDGKKLTAPQGSTVMEAAHSIGTYIPHFCYHKKLSIAANCRMCLVEVEKAPKPLPACATPVTDGMKVHTHSSMAKTAQAGVMEFLLINHPLDCPICDQGGECQLQDIAVGYGKSESRYQEEKRSVPGKDMGPLVSAEEMSRCIHCTRCVRFTEEIGGFQEIGMANRGEFSEILPFLGKTVTSEISGNVIDLCPVGALTSKPFRYSTRSWELSRRKSVAPHDGLGANLIVQVKQNTVMRVLPLENEAINECWLSDRDRFSYEGLNSERRLKNPKIKFDGKWHDTDWETALNYVVKGLNGVSADHGKDAVGFLLGARSTTEELYLAQKLARAFGVTNIDYRLGRSDFSADALRQGGEWLGLPVAELSQLDALLVVGSTLRSEQPLIAARLRQAARKRLKLSVVHVADDELLMNVHGKLLAAPQNLAGALAQVLKALIEIKGGDTAIDLSSVEVSAEARAIAQSLADGEKGAVVIGALAQQLPNYASVYAVTQEIARVAGGRFGVLSDAANSVGAEAVGALPKDGGANAAEMFAKPRKAYFLLNTEPEFDAYDAAGAVAALKQAQTVIALTAFDSEGLADYADVLLPIAPFSETAGSFVNMEGRLQLFNGVVKPLGETRPAWKVLRVLGNLLQLDGFGFNSAEDVRAELLAVGSIESRLNNALSDVRADVSAKAATVRVGEVPMFAVDAICRNAASLQATEHAAAPVALLSADLYASLGEPTEVLLKQGGAEVRMGARVDAGLAAGCVRVAAASQDTLALGGRFDAIEIKRG